jgi:hypothetical protein
VVAVLGDDDWRPNFQCNDRDRQRRQYALAKETLEKLTFDGAAVFHAHSQLSSIQIELRSSVWIAGERVRRRPLVERRELLRELLLDDPC